jgi:hypothetical protein
LTLGNFSDAATLFTSDLETKKFIGITTFPTTPVTPRPMPPLAYPNQQPKQSSSAFNNNNNNNNNNPAINNVNNYQQNSSSSSFQLAPAPQSRVNSNSITTSNNNNNTFVRPSDNKPMNGRNYPSASQVSDKSFELDFFFIRFALHRRCLFCVALIEIACKN